MTVRGARSTFTLRENAMKAGKVMSFLGEKALARVQPIMSWLGTAGLRKRLRALGTLSSCLSGDSSLVLESNLAWE